MNNFIFLQIKNNQDLERAFPIMKELRKDLTLEDFLNIYGKAHSANQYEIVALEKDGQILALMGYRILFDFVHQKHLYIDDLVSSEKYRSQGLGAKLLEYAEEIAKKLECHGLRLCTGLDNEQGKKFYEKNGWLFRAVVYKKKLKVKI